MKVFPWLPSSSPSGVALPGASSVPPLSKAGPGPKHPALHLPGIYFLWVSRCSRAFLWLIYTQPFSSWGLPWAPPNHHATSGNRARSRASVSFIVPLAQHFQVDNSTNSLIYVCIYLFASSPSRTRLRSFPGVDFSLRRLGNLRGVDMGVRLGAGDEAAIVHLNQVQVHLAGYWKVKWTGD